MEVNMRTATPTEADALIQVPIHTTRVRRKYSEKERPYKCEECDRSYAFQQSKDHHKRLKHRGAESKPENAHGKIQIQGIPSLMSSAAADYRHSVSAGYRNNGRSAAPSSDLAQLISVNGAYESILQGALMRGAHENKARSRHSQHNVQSRLPYTRMESRPESEKSAALRTLSLQSTGGRSDYLSQLPSPREFDQHQVSLTSQVKRASAPAISASSNLDWLYQRCSGVPGAMGNNTLPSPRTQESDLVANQITFNGCSSVDSMHPANLSNTNQANSGVSPSAQFSQLFDTFVKERKQSMGGQSSSKPSHNNCAQIQNGFDARRQWMNPTELESRNSPNNTEGSDGTISEDGSGSAQTQTTLDTRSITMLAACRGRSSYGTTSNPQTYSDLSAHMCNNDVSANSAGFMQSAYRADDPSCLCAPSSQLTLVDNQTKNGSGAQRFPDFNQDAVRLGQQPLDFEQTMQCITSYLA